MIFRKIFDIIYIDVKERGEKVLELNLEANTSNILYMQYMNNKTRPGDTLTKDESENEEIKNNSWRES